MAEPSVVSDRRGIHVPVWVFIAVGGVLLFGLAFAIGRRSEHHHDRFDGTLLHRGSEVRWPGVIFGLLLIAFIVTGIVLLVRAFARPTPNAAASSPTAAAEQVLADRLARGEIDEDEYRRRLAALRAS